MRFANSLPFAGDRAKKREEVYLEFLKPITKIKLKTWQKLILAEFLKTL
jgi:hypothetical protein